MMKNKLSDLNNHLFAQLERLSDEELTAEQLNTEVHRGDAIVAVAGTIIANAALQLKAASLIALHGDKAARNMPLLDTPK